MSELKVYHCNEWHNEYTEFYMKSAADKVIAEKDKEIARLNDKALQYKVLDKEHCRDLNTQERRFALQIAHHKYKRCLAIAERCAEAYNRECGLNPEEMTNKEFYKQQIEFWPRWNLRWLELAEKFKEAK